MAKKKKRPTAPPPPPVRTRAPRTAGAPSSRVVQKQAAAKAASRERLRRRIISAGLVVAVVAAVSGFVLQNRRASADLREALTAGSCTVDRETDPLSGGSGHVPSPTYQINPPAGGDHLGSAARAGVYAEGSVPDDGLLVHSLEHGYVVLWHASDLPDDQKAELAAVQAANPGDVIVAERASLPVSVAATAWNQRLLCGQLERAPIERFVAEYVGEGPEDVARG